jgi:hypothetical protein
MRTEEVNMKRLTDSAQFRVIAILTLVGSFSEVTSQTPSGNITGVALDSSHPTTSTPLPDNFFRPYPGYASNPLYGI